MAVKQLERHEWTKDGRKWIFYDYVKNLDGTRRKYKSKKFFTKTDALKAEREFLTMNTERADKEFKNLRKVRHGSDKAGNRIPGLRRYRSGKDAGAGGAV